MCEPALHQILLEYETENKMGAACSMHEEDELGVQCIMHREMRNAY